MEPSAFNSNS